ncbi:L-rhamnose mutarotase [Phyllobacterium sp. YR531]|uniref:L-rhamnose mutarotase n=1 Tax=Phyllobacterium sp. YR531 TaxID=1144343 RepID=UPI00026F74ED|nr:L-rhamnose mutarotase [Phyllobacterium sp. YR531]EJN06290.1 L-rhamnose 1-epimerase [Phyllobacterium sp. YR531]
MTLNPGMEDEYQRRHLEIWPELVAVLRGAGVKEYSIHLDRSTNTLFGMLSRPADHKMQTLAEHPVMKKWWGYMADIMVTNPDNSPVQTELVCVFQLP